MVFNWSISTRCAQFMSRKSIHARTFSSFSLTRLPPKNTVAPAVAFIDISPRPIPPAHLDLTPAQLSRSSAIAITHAISQNHTKEAYHILNSLRHSHTCPKTAISEEGWTEFDKVAIQYGQRVSLRLSYHAMLHGLIRRGAKDKAFRFAQVMMESGMRVRTTSIHAIVQLRPAGLLLRRGPVGVRPPPPLLSAESKCAVQILNAATRHRQQTNWSMWSLIIGSWLLKTELFLGALFFVAITNCIRQTNELAELDPPGDVCPSVVLEQRQRRALRMFDPPSSRLTGVHDLLSSIDEILTSNRPSKSELRLSALQALANFAQLVAKDQFPASEIHCLANSLSHGLEIETVIWIHDEQGQEQAIRAGEYFRHALRTLRPARYPSCQRVKPPLPRLGHTCLRQYSTSPSGHKPLMDVPYPPSIRLDQHQKLHHLIRERKTTRAIRRVERILQLGLEVRERSLEGLMRTILPPLNLTGLDAPEGICALHVAPILQDSSVLHLIPSKSRLKPGREALSLLYALRRHHIYHHELWRVLLVWSIKSGDPLLSSLIFASMMTRWRQCHLSGNAGSVNVKTNRKYAQIPPPKVRHLHLLVDCIRQRLRSSNHTIHQSAVQALAILANLLHTRRLPYRELASLVETLDNFPNIQLQVWIDSKAPRRVDALQYFNQVLKHLIDVPPTETRKFGCLQPPVDTFTGNALLRHALCSQLSPSLGDKVLKTGDWKPDIGTYTILITAGTMLWRRDIVDAAISHLRMCERRKYGDLETTNGPLTQLTEDFISTSVAHPPQNPQSQLAKRIWSEEITVPTGDAHIVDVPDIPSHTMVAIVKFLTATGQAPSVEGGFKRLIPSFAPFLGFEERNLAEVPFSEFQLAVQYGPHFLGALLNAMAKSVHPRTLHRYWIVAEHVERASWDSEINASCPPWSLHVHAFTSAIQGLGRCAWRKKGSRLGSFANKKTNHIYRTLVNRPQDIQQYAEVHDHLHGMEIPVPDGRLYNAMLACKARNYRRNHGRRSARHPALMYNRFKRLGRWLHRQPKLRRKNRLRRLFRRHKQLRNVLGAMYREGLDIPVGVRHMTKSYLVEPPLGSQEMASRPFALPDVTGKSRRIFSLNVQRTKSVPFKGKRRKVWQ